MRITAKPLIFTSVIMLSALAVGMVISRPRPLLRVEAQKLIDQEVCGGRPCPIEPGPNFTTSPGDDGVGFRAYVVAPRSHVVPMTPYGKPTGTSRYGIIGIASRTPLGWWWKAAVNIGIRPSQLPPNIAMVDNNYSARRIAWAKEHWDSASNADLYAEVILASKTFELREEAADLLQKLMLKSDNLAPKTIDSLY